MPPGGLGEIALRTMPVRLASSPNGLGVAALWVEFPPDPLRVALVGGEGLKTDFEVAGIDRGAVHGFNFIDGEFPLVP